ncbi:MAG: nucleotidyl transferase AbiEii/AbiGii toxin family protein [Clostridia bacterium]
MKRNTMSFKAIINNMAKENNVAAQSVLQTYMLERLLERISISKYKDNFILKGGMLISAMLGIDSRTTMDMDTTIKGFPLTKNNITNIMDEICNIEIDDNVKLKINKVELLEKMMTMVGIELHLKQNIIMKCQL